MPAERAGDPVGAVARLLARLQPERGRILLIGALAVISAALTVAGPGLLGHATDIVFNGVLGRHLPAGLSKQQALTVLRGEGHPKLARMLSGMNVVPGAAVDLARLGEVLGVAALVYVAAAGFGWRRAT